MGLQLSRMAVGEAPSVDVRAPSFYPFREGFPPSFFLFLCRFEPSSSHPTGISWVPER